MSNTFDSTAFRSALGTFATGVTVMTTVTPSGEMVGNTASSFNSVSLDPPLVLWSLARKAYSYETYMAAKYFAVNVLREGQDDLSARFSKVLSRQVAQHRLRGLGNRLPDFAKRARHF